ncbi:MAG TPA: class II fructose-bisphosphate aldolase [Streptosporangiaceae bacterium]|nr:class II fructose-bisphosphate aldolase [Streptosporangiaceae bacterium]
MTLATTRELVDAARAAGGAAVAFNVIGIEHAEAIVVGAQAAGTPVILQISENCVRYHGAVEPIVAATLAVAASSGDVPVAVHLDHATSVGLVSAAVSAGIRSVMFDASALDYASNVAATAEIARWCHDRGVWVEAELGEVGGKDGVHAPGARTKPAQAAEYVLTTGVDGLAVAVGSSHAMLTKDAVLDLELVKQLRTEVSVPLVLHGSSGVPDDVLVAAVRSGLTKINIATALNKVFTEAVRVVLAADQRLVDPRKYMAAGREAVAGEVARLLGVLALGESSAASTAR